MAQIKINGIAKKKFNADVMKVYITVTGVGESAAIAIKKGKSDTEKILKLLQGVGINLSDVFVEADRVSAPGNYDDDNLYRFKKKLTFTSQVNLSLLELLKDGIVKEEIRAVYDESFVLSDMEKFKSSVLQDALLNSKNKAEAIAESLGKKIIGIESAKCDEYADIEDINQSVHYLRGDINAVPSLSELLSPDTVLIEKSIDVIWIIE